MNLNETTRKKQVLDFLKRNRRWVDGPEIANAEVGGSEGHRRLRELRAEGYRIIQRRHPDPKRDIWQYLLVRDEWSGFMDDRPTSAADFVEKGSLDTPPLPPPVPTMDEIQPEPEPNLFEVYTTVPKRIELGQTVICPRCHGYRKKERMTKKGRLMPADAICYDPEQPTKPCHRCGGLGLVPNIGPVP